MSIQRYFKILGIPPTKNKQLVKRAYRKKAMKYHPDRNDSATAKQKFIEVTEAYDQLLLALKRAETTSHTTQSENYQQQRSERTTRKTTYKQTQQNTTKQQAQSKEEQEERVKKARQRYERMKQQEAEEDERYYRTMTSGKSWRRFKIIMFACTLISVLMTLDKLYFTTSTQRSSIVKKNVEVTYAGANNLKTSPVIFDNGQKAWIPLSLIAKEQRNYLYLERTLFFKEIKYVKIWRNNQWENYTPDYSLISTYPLVHLFLLLPLLTYFLKAKTMMFSILYHTSISFLPFALLFVLISNDRWIHLLTLGIL